MKNSNAKNGFLTNPLVITLTALLCCALWGSATPAIKIGYELMLPDKDVPSTILFAGMRFFFAGILTVIIFSIARRKVLIPKVENLGRIGIVSVIQTILQYIFFYVGLANTSGVKGTILTGSSTFFAILIASLIFKQEKLNAKKIIACVLGLGGIVVINLNGLSLSMNFLGDAFCVFSAISLALSSTLIKRFSKHEDPVTISGYQFIFGGEVMMVIGLSFGGMITVDSIKAVLLLAYLALLSAVAYSLWGILLKYNPVSKVTVFSFTTPVFGVLLSTLLLTEESGVEILNLVSALVLVALGIFILNADLGAMKSRLLSKKAVKASRHAR